MEAPRYTPASTIADERPRESVRIALAWLVAFAAAGVALALLFPDGPEQDGGSHFLHARDVWYNSELLVDIWGRPLFTALYALPAIIGYLPAKLFTVGICVATAWQTWRWAEDEGLARATLAIPLFALQPSVLIVSSDTLGEPLFALTLVVALRLRLAGHTRAGLVVASLLPLAGPEGWLLCLLFGAAAVADGRLGPLWPDRVFALRHVVAGVFVWWVAAVVVSGDPIFFWSRWPGSWASLGSMGGARAWLERWQRPYEVVAWRDPIFFWHRWQGGWPSWGSTEGFGAWLDWWRRRYEVIAHSLRLPFFLGLVMLLAQRRLRWATALALLFFAAHTLFYHFSTRYGGVNPRYFASVAPAIALITLAGWNVIADAVWSITARTAPLFRRMGRGMAYGAATIVLLVAGRDGLYFVDNHPSARDAQAVADVAEWLRSHPVPVRLVIWSQPYMCIALYCDTRHRLYLSSDHAKNAVLLRSTGPETLVFWDGETGPNLFALRAADFDSAGYRRLFAKAYELRPRFAHRSGSQQPTVRSAEMILYYKADTAALDSK